MNDIIIKEKDIQKFEEKLLGLPQLDCPIQHIFGPGIYVRQATMPAGSVVIGHKHKTRHMNIMIKGKIAIIEGDEKREIVAPCIFNAEPGRKIAYVIEETTWLNVHATEETDIEKLEEMFLDKSEYSINKEKATLERETILKEDDRCDFKAFLKEYNLDPKWVRAVSEIKDDIIDLPEHTLSFISVRNSPIEGKGIFISWPIKKDFIFGPVSVSCRRTIIGRYTNHSNKPNCEFVKIGDDYFAKALRDIEGCTGGGHGEELTVDYRQVLSLREEVKCQE